MAAHRRVREYVARGIPVHALDLNVPILDRLVASIRTKAPDRLSSRAVAPKWRPVSAPVSVGTGDMRIQLIPVRGEMGERMMIGYLPGLKLVYSSDLITRGRQGSFFMPGMLAEVVSALVRENAGPPEKAVGMHLTPTSWSEIEAAVRPSGVR